MMGEGGELFFGIKSMYVDSSACVRIKGGESEQFRIDSGVRQGYIMSTWLFNVYMDGVMKEGNELPRGWESGDCLASCMQMICFYVVSQSRT